MRSWATVTLVLTLTSLCVAQTAPLVPPEVLAQIKDDDPNPLPRYMTAAERLIPLPMPLRSDPPTGEVYCATEYDLNEGMLIRWGHYNSTLTELTVGVTTLDPQAIAYILVTGPSQQSSATATLTSAGANMNQVEFITYTTNTGWIRDYGPRFVFEDGMRAIIDHTYNRPRPLDNAFPDFLASLWGEPEYDMPLIHGGGNFHSFANGDAFMSDLILLENPGLSEQDVKDIIQDYKGCDLTIYEGFPWSVDGTKHIDMWMQPLDDYKVIIGQYSQPGTYPPQQITDGAAADLIARGYTVYRTPGWNSGSGGYNGTHYTYTNSVVLNDLVFIPSFSGYATQNAEALAVFQTALPDHQIIQIDCSSIIHAAGAIHCSMMHVPGYDLGPVPLVNVLSPDGSEVWTVGEEHDIRWIAIDNVAVTSVDIHLSTDGGASFPHEIATGLANSGVYPWEVPALSSEQCRVKVVAHDGDGNSGEDTSDGDFTITPFGPQVMYEFLMDTDPGWSTEDLWDFGQPTGGGGQYGGPDPTSGYTGSNVYGYNLSGDYQPNLPERHLTSTAIDCTGLGGVTLGFWRWLGVEQPAYDHAYVRVSNDGSNWQTVWQNTAEVADYSWSYQEYDISTVADDQATVYLRWTMGTTDYTWQYCGWNIDDVEIIAVPTVLLGDLNCDGVLNAFDIDPFVLALTDPAGYAAAWPNCDRMLADCNGDGEVNAFDIDPFVDLLTGG